MYMACAIYDKCACANVHWQFCPGTIDFQTMILPHYCTVTKPSKCRVNM